MTVHMHPVIGFIAMIWAIIATGMLYYFWRKSSGLYALLIEGAGRYEDMRQLNRSLEGSMQAADQKMSGHRQEVGRLQDELAASRKGAKQANDTLTAKDLELKTVREKLEGQKRYLESELNKAQTALDAMMSERNQAADHLREQKDNLGREVKQLKTTFEHQLDALMKDLKTKQNQVSEWETKYKKVDPIEVIKVKRKIHHYERLYQSMKGLREMADERNRNWEVALRKLSHWILAESGCVKTRGAPPEDIGPLVGQAMAAIGAQLVDDNEADDVFDAHAGASRLDSMHATNAVADVIDNG